MAVKMTIFKWHIAIFFLFSHKIDCGHSLEPHHKQNLEINVYPYNTRGVQLSLNNTSVLTWCPKYETVRAQLFKTNDVFS